MTADGVKHISHFAEAALAELQRPRLVTIEDNCFDVHDPAQYGCVYSIPIITCTSRDDVLWWIRQLSEKSWVTKLVIEDFVNVVIQHFDVRG